MLSYSFGPQLERPPPIWHKFASRLRASKVDPSRLASSTQLSDFLQILTQTSTRLRRVTPPTPCHPFRLGPLWHLSATSICQRARVNTCPNVSPNQPMHRAERLPAQPNPKARTEIPGQLYNRSRCSSPTRRKTNCICFQSTYRNGIKICKHRARASSCRFWLWAIQDILIWM